MTYFKFNILDLYTKWTHWLHSHQAADDTMNQLDYMEKRLQSIETLLLKIYANQQLTTYPTPMAMHVMAWPPDITNEDSDTNNEE